MTITDVTINTAVKCEEMLTNKWITDNTLHVYFDLLKKLSQIKKTMIFNQLIRQEINTCDNYEHLLVNLYLSNKTFYDSCE